MMQAARKVIICAPEYYVSPDIAGDAYSKFLREELICWSIMDYTAEPASAQKRHLKLTSTE